jgi:anti-sigma factor RsiW
MNDDDVETINILDEYLDGALDAGQERELLQRLRREPALAAELVEMKEARAVRASIFASLEPSPSEVERVVSSITQELQAPRRRPLVIRLFRPIAAAAACVAAGFLGGYLLRPASTQVTSNPTPSPESFQVAITDDTGRTLGVQKFDSMDKAREFSEDLRRWQQWQEQLRNQEVVVRSASF